MDARPRARSGDRSAAVDPCSACGELTGRGYPSCLGCVDVVDRRWLTDWRALLEGDGAGAEAERALATRVLSAEAGTFAWTCVDWALRLLRCEECGGELGAGDPVCLRCAAADASRWSIPATSDHTLRVAALALRAPQRRRGAVVSTLRLALPFVLAGGPVSGSQLRAIRGAVLAGRYADLARLGSVVELANLPLLPWRRRSTTD